MVVLLDLADDVDGAGEGIRAEEGGVASLDDLHAVDILEVDEGEVKNVVDGTVEPDAIVKDHHFISVAAADGDGLFAVELFLDLHAVVGAQKIAGIHIAAQLK
ncbi:MAG: hypothetical protein BWY77_01307 [bacterium ADurb.Bin431]|nr:MAG: hypothetical protein BWY77_01307 [bacterium ADurb.Bin431]